MNTPGKKLDEEDWRHAGEGAPLETPRFKKVVERRVLPNGQTRVTFDDHCEQFLQAAAAEALRCDPKYCGRLMRKDVSSSCLPYMPLCRNGVYWASAWELRVDHSDRVPGDH